MEHLNKVRKLVMSALLAALCCVATLIIQIPSPTGGYLHLGDAMVLLCGWLLGPIWGAVAAGLGSMLADVFSGYALYAPATLLIKALVALIACMLLKTFAKLMPRHRISALALSGVCAEIWMILGYFAFDALFVGYGWGAVAGIPGNAVQAAFGVVVGAVLMHVMERIKIKERFLEEHKTKF